MVESVEVIIKQPGQADRVVRLQEGATRMGRAEDNEVVLSDVGVSRRHAQVYVSRGEVTVEDLGSGNGTYYNGYRIQSQPISDGDEIVVDPFVLQFRIRGQTGSRPLENDEVAPARLDVVVGTGLAGNSYPITSRGLSVGRAEDRDVVIPDPAASRHHAQISLQSGEYVLRDMGSANGIFVNAVRVRECTLADGDILRIGNTEMRFTRYQEGGASGGEMAPQGQQGEDWQSSWEEPPPAKKGRGGLILGIILIAVILALGFLFFAVLFAVIIVVLAMQPAGMPAATHLPPSWQVELPGGLPATPLQELADSGTRNMAQGKRREAMEDFYRVLSTDPASYSYVDNFAFATAEGLVLESLHPQVEKLQAERLKKESRRDVLLDRARKSGRVARNAKQELEDDFRGDPVVIDHFGWKATESMVEAQKKASDAKQLVAMKKADEAVPQLMEALALAVKPELRAQAWTTLEQARQMVTEQSLEATQIAVIQQLEGEDKALAKQQIDALAAAHPAHASARLRQAML